MAAAPVIECVEFKPGWEPALATFLQALDASGDSRFFSPHPSDAATLCELAARPRRDVYCLLVEERSVIGYGLLRGWDEGYDIPSLGIAIHPQARSIGLGRLLMDYLELMAARRGAGAVRLRVFKQNATAVALYSRRGYAWTVDPGNDDLLVGLKSIGAGKP